MSNNGRGTEGVAVIGGVVVVVVGVVGGGPEDKYRGPPGTDRCRALACKATAPPPRLPSGANALTHRPSPSRASERAMGGGEGRSSSRSSSSSDGGSSEHGAGKKKKQRRSWSRLEIALTVTASLFVVACAALIAVAWLAVEDSKQSGRTERTELSGNMKIVTGAEFTPALLDRESAEFKTLAFDFEKTINDVYSASAMKNDYISCKVLTFRSGSVSTSFGLEFFSGSSVQSVVDEALATLKEAIVPLGGGSTDGRLGRFTVDLASVGVSGTCPTSLPRLYRGNLCLCACLSADVCSLGQKQCHNSSTACVYEELFCDGNVDCSEGSDETPTDCDSGCDDNFLLTGMSGSFNSMNFPGDYIDYADCRWIIRWVDGYAVQISFSAFALENRYDFLKIYKGLGPDKELQASLTGTSIPGDVRVFSHELTVEFTSDMSQTDSGFSATFTAVDFSGLTNKDLVDCSFESGWCYWDQDPYDSANWERLSGPSSPATTGPDVDHTFGNSSGFYIRNQNSGVATSIRTFTLDPEPNPTCLKFWYYMYGVDVYRLSLSLRTEGVADVPLWQNEGNYGNQWHYGQLNFSQSQNFQVVFEARRRASESEIALDDISLEPGACPELPYPEPTPFIITTPVPTTTPPPPPRDCDGPHELREPNVTFTSPRFPFAYMDNADCTWYLLADEGKNVLLHFSVFSLENNYDYVELRDGYGSDAPLIGRYTGSGPREDVFSTASAMTVRFTSDSSINSAGFNANFSTGVRLGMPPTCAPDQFQCQDLECVAREAVCDRNVDCSDGSDEKNCVRLQNRVGPSGVAQFLVDSQWHSVCSSAAWITQFNAFVCLYTGYP
ncbi:unnamed protein product [Lampetra planeri]